MFERVGAWEVNVGLGAATAVKVSGPDRGRRTSVTVQRFPVGYRVGKDWSTPVPKSVQQAAERMLRKLTGERR